MFYFDTMVFRYLADASAANTAQIRTAVSPITAAELLSQLTIGSNEKVLRAIECIRTWVDPDKGLLLDWPQEFVAEKVFGKQVPSSVVETVGTALNTCLGSGDPAMLRTPALQLTELLEREKEEYVTATDHFLAGVKKSVPDPISALDTAEFYEAFAAGIARQVGCSFDGKQTTNIVQALDAYRVATKSLFKMALESGYNLKKNANDVFDLYQLWYLADPELVFVTCDGGIFSKVGDSPQTTRILLCEAAGQEIVKALARFAH